MKISSNSTPPRVTFLALLTILSALGLMACSGEKSSTPQSKPAPKLGSEEPSKKASKPSTEDPFKEIMKEETRNPEGLDVEPEEKTVVPPLVGSSITLPIRRQIRFFQQGVKSQGQLKIDFGRTKDEELVADFTFTPATKISALNFEDLISIWISGDGIGAKVFSYSFVAQNISDVNVNKRVENQQTGLKNEDHAWALESEMSNTTIKLRMVMVLPELEIPAPTFSAHFFQSNGNNQHMPIASHPQAVNAMQVLPETFQPLNFASLPLVDIGDFKAKVAERRKAIAAFDKERTLLKQAKDKSFQITDVAEREAHIKTLEKREIQSFHTYTKAQSDSLLVNFVLLRSKSPADLSAQQVIDFDKRFPLAWDMTDKLLRKIYEDSRIAEALEALETIVRKTYASGPHGQKEAYAFASALAFEFGMNTSKDADVSGDFMRRLKNLEATMTPEMRLEFRQDSLLLELCRSEADDAFLKQAVDDLVEDKALLFVLDRIVFICADPRFDQVAPFERTITRVNDLVKAKADPDASVAWARNLLNQHLLRKPSPQNLAFVLPLIEGTKDLPFIATMDRDKRFELLSSFVLAGALFGDAQSNMNTLKGEADRIAKDFEKPEDAKERQENLARVLLEAMSSYRDVKRSEWLLERLPVVQPFIDEYASDVSQVSLRQLLIPELQKKREWELMGKAGEELIKLISEYQSQLGEDELNEELKVTLRNIVRRGRYAQAHGLLLSDQWSAEGYVEKSVKPFLFDPIFDDYLPSLMTSMLRAKQIQPVSQSEKVLSPAGGMHVLIRDPSKQAFIRPRIEAISKLMIAEGKEALSYSFLAQVGGLYAQLNDHKSAQFYFDQATTIAESQVTALEFAKGLVGFDRVTMLPMQMIEDSNDFERLPESISRVQNLLSKFPLHPMSGQLKAMMTRQMAAVGLMQGGDMLAALDPKAPAFETSIEILFREARTKDARRRERPHVHGGDFFPAGFALRYLGHGDASAKVAKLVAFSKRLEELKQPKLAFRVLVAASQHAINIANLPLAKEYLKAAQAFAKRDPASSRVGVLFSDYLQLEMRIASRQQDYAGAAKAALKAVDILKAAQLAKDSLAYEHVDQVLPRFTKSAEVFTQLAKSWPEEQKRRAEGKNLPQVDIQTSEGSVTLELFEDDAPNTVANFIDLVTSGYFEGIRFHRWEPGFVIQGGSASEDGQGPSDWSIQLEANRDHYRGSLAMARSQSPDSASRQFYIVLEDGVAPTNLNGGYAVFGRVIKGMDVIDRLRAGSTLLKAAVSKKRAHEYKVKRIN